MKFAFVPKDVVVWDNLGEEHGGTHDRYAVLFPDGACFTMNGFPFNEDGFTEYRSQGYKPTADEVVRDRVPSQVVAKIYELMV